MRPKLKDDLRNEYLRNDKLREAYGGVVWTKNPSSRMWHVYKQIAPQNPLEPIMWRSLCVSSWLVGLNLHTSEPFKWKKCRVCNKKIRQIFIQPKTE